MLVKSSEEVWCVNKLKQSDEKRSPNNNDDIRKPSSKFRDEIRSPSLKQQSQEYIWGPSKLDNQIPAATGTWKVGFPPYYGTGDVKNPPKMMGEKLTPP